MLRLAVALVIVAVVAVVAATVARSVSRRFRGLDAGDIVAKGDGMAKISFFLLLCLMAYAILTGAG